MSFDPFIEIPCFRRANPAFNDKTTWPNAVLLSALEAADMETSGSRWGQYADNYKNRKRKGLFLYAAHWLVSYYPNGATDIEKQKSTDKGQLTSKSVGDESASYAVFAPASVKDAAESWYLKTVYGQQFIKLKRRVLAGPVVV